METITTHGNFDQVIEDAAPEVQAIATQLRDLIIEIYPAVVEVPWPHQKTVGYGVGPKKMSEHFCYLAPQKTRVNLGFFHGSELADPEKLLDGTGKKLRHIKIESKDQADQPEIRALLMRSLEERQASLGKA